MNSGPVWMIPLDTPCRLRWVGYSVHGTKPFEVYRMLGFWSTHFYQYSGTLEIAGQRMPIKPGHASIVPPNTEATWHFDQPRCEHLCAHFMFPDNARGGVPVPTMQNLAGDFEDHFDDLAHAVGKSVSQPRRAEARVWDVLWRLVERANLPLASGESPPASSHPAVAEARRLIEERLHEPLNVPELAEAAGVSHNHLTRLFKAAFLQTVVGYIRSRRLDRARHLLTNTTQPIKAIAREVGIPDPHLFNKMIRKDFGAPPRTIRARQQRRSL